MPLCFIYTNLKDSDLGTDFEEKLTACVADVLNKPTERISVFVNSGTRMTFSGKKQSGLLCQIHSIAVFDEARNPGYFPKIFDFLTGTTKLDAKQIAIEFVDLPAHMVKTGV